MVLDELDWDLDKKQKRQTNNVLTATEKSYLVTGEGGQYSTSQLNDVHKRIRSKGKNLPNRFQNLIDDLLLFSVIDLPAEDSTLVVNRDFVREQILKDSIPETLKSTASEGESTENNGLDEEKDETQTAGDFSSRNEYSSLAENLLNVENRAGQTQDVSDNHIVNPATEFGIEFGSALSMFLKSCDSQAAYEEIIFGMLIAGVDSSESSTESSQRKLAHILDRFESHYERRNELVKKSNKRRQERNKKLEQERTEIKQALLSCGIDPTDDLTAVIQSTIITEDSRAEFVREYDYVWEFTQKIVQNIDEDSAYVSKNISGVIGRDVILFLFYCYNEKHKTGEDITESIRFDDMSADALDQNYTYPVEVESFSSYINVTRQNITKALSILADNHNYKHIDTDNPHYSITKEVNNKWKLTGYGRAVALNLLSDNTQYIHEYARRNIDVKSYNEYFAAEDTICEIMSHCLPKYDNKTKVRNDLLSDTLCLQSREDQFEKLVRLMD